MKKISIIILITLLASYSNGQSLTQATAALKKIKSLDDIGKWKTKYPAWNITIDKTILSDSAVFPDIVNANTGDIVLKQFNPQAPAYVLKVMKKEDVELCKVKYIFLSGEKYSKARIDSIRNTILERYKNGEDFETLVKEFTMDKNPTGDLGWFHKDMMVEEFDSAVRNRSKGEIFTVDVDMYKWYYVVLKTHDNKFEKAIVSIKIKYNK